MKRQNIAIILFRFSRLNIFRPEKLFESSVSFGADIQFNERKTEYDWNKIVQNKVFYKFVCPTTLCYNKSYEKR